MIDINLIPAALRKNGQRDANAVGLNYPKEVLWGVGTVLVLLLATVHLILGALWYMGNSHLAKNNAEWQRVLPDKTTMDSMKKESTDLTKKIGVITDMTVQKTVLWSPKFNAISDNLPKGLWLRKMVLDKTSLTMEGSVVSKNQTEINNVGAFIFALKQNADFMKDFSSLEVNSIQRGKNNAVDVTDFTVMAKLK